MRGLVRLIDEKARKDAGCEKWTDRDNRSGWEASLRRPHKKDLEMQLDIYRDQALERLLIVERGTNINQLTGIKQGFLNGLDRPNQIDSDFDKLPTGIKSDEVLQTVKQHGFFASTFVTHVREIDPSN